MPAQRLEPGTEHEHAAGDGERARRSVSVPRRALREVERCEDPCPALEKAPMQIVDFRFGDTSHELNLVRFDARAFAPACAQLVEKRLPIVNIAEDVLCLSSARERSRHRSRLRSRWRFQRRTDIS